MIQMVGADPDALVALASQMTTAAERLDSIRSGVTANLSASPWKGGDADTFQHAWRGQLSGLLSQVEAMLREANKELKRNADQQRQASADGGPGLGAGLISLIGWFKSVWESAQREFQWATGEGLKQLQSELHNSPADQLAWWNGLTSDQQNALICFAPASLLMLTGIPADVRYKASQSEVSAHRGDFSETTKTWDLAAGVTIPFEIADVEIGGDATMVETTFADHHVEVSLTYKADGGAALGIPGHGSVGIGPDGDTTRTYSFASADQAHHFEDGLKNVRDDWLSHETDPSNPLGLFNPLGALAPGLAIPVALAGGVASGALSLDHYLDGYKDHLTGNAVGGGITSDLKFGVPGVQGTTTTGNIDLVEGAHAKHDSVTGETTASVYLDAKAAATLTQMPGFGLEGTASGNVHADLTWGADGTLKTLTLSGDGTVAGAVGSPTSPLDALVGKDVSFHATLDLTNPANQAVAVAVLTNPTDPVVLAHATESLYNNAQVVVQTSDVTTQGPPDVDAVVAKFHDKTTTLTHPSTMVKPPGGVYVHLEN